MKEAIECQNYASNLTSSPNWSHRRECHWQGQPVLTMHSSVLTGKLDSGTEERETLPGCCANSSRRRCLAPPQPLLPDLVPSVPISLSINPHNVQHFSEDLLRKTNCAWELQSCNRVSRLTRYFITNDEAMFSWHFLADDLGSTTSRRQGLDS